MKSEQLGSYAQLAAGQFAFHLSFPGGAASHSVNIPIDAAIQPMCAPPGALPLLIEAKSAGDSTNTNKRRKEEDQKLAQLRRRHGHAIRMLLLLCGYFEPGYLGYEAAEGIDWIWEHRLNDLEQALANPAPADRTTRSLRETSPTVGAPPTIEQRRSTAQREIESSRSVADRNRSGQFSTPFPLAVQVFRGVARRLDSATPRRFLEPSCGTGVFFSAAAAVEPLRAFESRVGIEVDSEFARAARSLWAGEGVEIVEADFVEFCGRREQAERFNLLCTNPPYVRHHHLEAELKRRLQLRVEAELGLRVSGLTGLYVYFILLSHRLLEDGGVACWLIPSEFLSVNYGEALRRYLTTRVTLLDVFQFDPEDVQFEDALVSSCVITYRKKAPQAGHAFEYRYGGDFATPSLTRRVLLDSLAVGGKWRFHAADEGGTELATSISLGDLFEVRRGIATGANDFFVMSMQEAQERGIPRHFLKPVVTSPRQLADSIIHADAEGTPTLESPKFLLDCPLRPEKIRGAHPGLWSYLEQGRASGVADGYLCQSREVWYFQEQRDPAMFLISYMGRSSAGRAAPFRFFRNLSRAIATNGFLNLYPTPALTAAIRDCPDRASELLVLLNSVPGEVAVNSGRSYGGGLHKLEPRELLTLPLANPPAWLTQAAKPAQLALI